VLVVGGGADDRHDRLVQRLLRLHVELLVPDNGNVQGEQEGEAEGLEKSHVAGLHEEDEVQNGQKRKPAISQKRRGGHVELVDKDDPAHHKGCVEERRADNGSYP
jgi:hypothetical protein